MDILTKLSKKDNKWRSIALSICKDKNLADDLVNDAYLKVKDYKEVKDYMMVVVIRNLFYNHIKKQKEISLSELHYLKAPDRIFEPDDYEKKILD